MQCRSFYLVLIAFLALSLPARACINESATNRRGESVEPMSYFGAGLKEHLLTRASPHELILHSEEVVKNAQTDPSFDSLNNLAAVLIRHGRLPRAVKLLQLLERKYPGHYETAANIGTAYELMGRNEDALKWILEGIKRNPDDHEGTEWLHVHILKAKLGLIPKPAAGRSILNLDFGNDVMPRRPTGLPMGNDGKPLSLFAVAHALRYQLIERVAFVAPPDPMVAGLLLDWANLELVAGTLESADALYDVAARYGSTERRIIAVRKAEAVRIIAKAESSWFRSEGKCELCERPRKVP